MRVSCVPTKDSQLPQNLKHKTYLWITSGFLLLSKKKKRDLKQQLLSNFTYSQKRVFVKRISQAHHFSNMCPIQFHLSPCAPFPIPTTCLHILFHYEHKLLPWGSSTAFTSPHSEPRHQTKQEQKHQQKQVYPSCLSRLWAQSRHLQGCGQSSPWTLVRNQNDTATGPQLSQSSRRWKSDLWKSSTRQRRSPRTREEMRKTHESRGIKVAVTGRMLKVSTDLGNKDNNSSKGRRMLEEQTQAKRGSAKSL